LRSSSARSASEASRSAIRSRRDTPPTDDDRPKSFGYRPSGVVRRPQSTPEIPDPAPARDQLRRNPATTSMSTPNPPHTGPLTSNFRMELAQCAPHLRNSGSNLRLVSPTPNPS
jgi:hypothetical protein